MSTRETKMRFGELTGAWDYSELPPNVHLGRDCWLERKESFGRFRSERSPGLVLGDRVRVYSWTTFNVEPTGFVEVGSDTLLVGAIFMCQERISIGSGVVVSYGVTLADSDFHPMDAASRKLDAIANSPRGDRSSRPAIESRPILLGDGVWIGIGAMVLKGVEVGTGARIGAGAVVTSDVPPGAFFAGNPARVARDER